MDVTSRGPGYLGLIIASDWQHGITKNLVMSPIAIQFTWIMKRTMFLACRQKPDRILQVCVNDERDKFRRLPMEEIPVAGDGSWSADFSGVFDIQVGMWIASFPAVMKMRMYTTLGENPPIPHIEASLINNWIYFWEFQPSGRSQFNH